MDKSFKAWRVPLRRRPAWLFILLAFGIILFLVLYFIMSGLAAPEPGSERTVVFQVTPGATAGGIAQDLAEERLIRNQALFVALARYRGVQNSLQAGEYLLGPSMSANDILTRLVRGAVMTYPVTIPEGYTVEEIAARLAAEGICGKEEFLAAARQSDLISYLPAEADLIDPLEGYLFPDTYHFLRDMDPNQVLQVMWERFEAAFKAEYVARAEEIGLTIHETVTLASIVEKEVMTDSERPLVAAVYHNRLRIGMKLDADPTLKYALEDRNRPLYHSDKEMDSPYNTYRRAGLPPGPICSPGEASLVAALYPADVPYLYFVSRNDGTHDFSETYAEHLIKVNRYQPG
ncbi:MAG: endolytic transglycosylase MltG [Bacillota bacterium]